MKTYSSREILPPTEITEFVEKETSKSGFAELLTIPEGSSLPADKREDLQTAANDIAALIYSPLRAGENTLNQERISPATRELFAEPVERVRQSLELFESVVNDLKGKGENVASSVILTVKEKSETETVFLITPNTESPDYKQGQGLGQIRKTRVRKVEIVVKTAESDKEQTYTPQTIKFIAQDKKGKQIENFRIEVHSTQKRNDKPQYVQVDADIGGKRLARTHLDVESLGRGEEALNNFRLLQYAFLVNFAEKIFTTKSTSFKNDSHQQRLERIITQAKENLGLPVERKMTKEAEAKIGEVTLEELQQAVNNIPSVLVDYLGEPLYKIWDISENGISPADKVLCYLFEMEPHQITQKDIVVLNGKATRAMETLVNFSSLKAASPEDALEQISKDPVLVQVGQKIMDEVQEPEVLISQLGKLATVQDIIAGKNNAWVVYV